MSQQLIRLVSARDKTVVDVLAGSGVFDSFETAMKASGLDKQLAEDGDFTVFVPSDEAFGRMSDKSRNALPANETAMKVLLAKQVVTGRNTATDLMQIPQLLHDVYSLLLDARSICRGRPWGETLSASGAVGGRPATANAASTED
ncbi:MAG: fasciclin domain-containing protein [Thiohalocapsa sp.]